MPPSLCETEAAATKPAAKNFHTRDGHRYAKFGTCLVGEFRDKPDVANLAELVDIESYLLGSGVTGLFDDCFGAVPRKEMTGIPRMLEAA